MESSPTHTIIEQLTRAIVEHRLRPGTRLVEQKLADHFGVSRTLVRQALFHLAEHRLVHLEPSRGACVATPSAEEARQVFAVRRMLESAMVREFVHQLRPSQIQLLKAHLQEEQRTLKHPYPIQRNALLGDFHLLMARLMNNTVLTQALQDLILRCSVITLMYQSDLAASQSHEDHEALLQAIVARDAEGATRLMQEHLLNVERALVFERHLPANDLSLALSATAP